MAGTNIANHAEFNVVPENLLSLLAECRRNKRASARFVQLQCTRFASLARSWAISWPFWVLASSANSYRSLPGSPARASLCLTTTRAGWSWPKPTARNGCAVGKRNPAEAVLELTHGKGCDSVMIAAATQSSEPFMTAAEIARDRATVCQVGTRERSSRIACSCRRNSILLFLAPMVQAGTIAISKTNT